MGNADVKTYINNKTSCVILAVYVTMMHTLEAYVLNREWASQVRRELLSPGSRIRNDPNFSTLRLSFPIRRIFSVTATPTFLYCKETEIIFVTLNNEKLPKYIQIVYDRPYKFLAMHDIQ
jgi:hypothetical protein